jgi:hypothetical protein
LTVPSTQRVRFLLIQPKGIIRHISVLLLLVAILFLFRSHFVEEFDSIGLYLVGKCSERITNPSVLQDEANLVVNPDFSDVNECMFNRQYLFCDLTFVDYVERTLDAGSYVMLPCSFDAGQNGDFQIRYGFTVALDCSSDS